ncbi:MAG: RimK family protein [Cyclobacteriaceae bacterium]
MPKIVVTEKPENWKLDLEGVDVVAPSQYLSSTQYQTARDLKVVNLCRSYQYQSQGYYVSLLAEARSHKVLPDVATLQDFRFQRMVKDESSGFEQLIQTALEDVKADRISFNIYFGFIEEKKYRPIGLLLFNLFQAPILQATFIKKDSWELSQLKAENLDDVEESERQNMLKPLEHYLSGKKLLSKKFSRKKFDLAILVNAEDPNPPSDEKAIQNFVNAAEKLGFNVDLIGKNDFGKLIQYDALFVRETTRVDQHTFRFAKKAASEGLVVIDDPDSILKCTNKVYLFELLQRAKIPTPKTLILYKDQKNEALKEFSFPFILKEPDGSFSKGVKKVKDEKALKEELKSFFKKSELVVAQEFFPTDFDWRIGILDRRPLYICKYYMAGGHWQIVDWSKSGQAGQGNSEAVPIWQVPVELVETALKAANLIGDGLYGVDIKERDGKFYVIEVNDNPSIDEGIEDAYLKQGLYHTIMESFLRRLEQRNSEKRI